MTALKDYWQGRQVKPPLEDPDRAAGYLGYYCRHWLPVVFDLVDLDGLWPAVWWYSQQKSRTFRLIEEKPSGQSISPSQERTYRSLIEWIEWRVKREEFGLSSGIYIIHGAERLIAIGEEPKQPQFPVEIERLASTVRPGARSPMDVHVLNAWLLMAEAPSAPRFGDFTHPDTFKL